MHEVSSHSVGPPTASTLQKKHAQRSSLARTAPAGTGTLVASFPPGRVGLARQYIDFTGVPVTFSNTHAKFTSVTQPFSQSLNKQLDVTLRRVQGLGEGVRLAYTYWLSSKKRGRPNP